MSRSIRSAVICLLTLISTVNQVGLEDTLRSLLSQNALVDYDDDFNARKKGISHVPAPTQPLIIADDTYTWLNGFRALSDYR
jgi:hypothetical protein